MQSKKQKQKSASAKVKGVNLHKTSRGASSVNSTTKYGFNSSVVSTKKVNSKPIFRFIDDINNKVDMSDVRAKLKGIIRQFLNSISQKMSKESLPTKKLKEAKARIIIHLNEYVNYLTTTKRFEKADLDSILSIIRALVQKHTLKKTMDILLIIKKGAKLEGSNSNNAYNSNNSSNW
jgi:hypothetical protein